MLLECEVEEGLIPSERIVRVQRADGGFEEVAVDASLVQGGAVAVSRLGERQGRILVELPRESMSGRWRVWIHPDTIVEPVR